jgi:hypothetical protein
MSYNDIGDMFSQYSKGDPKNCQHLKELFEQAVTQMIEEGEIVMLEVPQSNIKKPQR